LRKFGFVLNGLGEWIYNDGGFKLVQRDGFVLKIVDQIVSYRPIVHLHQLQNLYSALTGEELTE
jgi:hypothetical protein